MSYSINQMITENNQSNYFTSANGNIMITKNATISNLPKKSGYEPKTKEVDGTVDADITSEVTDFLETFFKLYHPVTEKGIVILCRVGCTKTNR